MLTNNFFLVVCIILFLSGCAVVVNETVSQPMPAIHQPAVVLKQLIDLNNISVGQSLDKVNSLLDETIIIGHTVIQEGQTTPVSIKSLFKEETMHIQGFTYHVRYYFTHIVHPDDEITEDELTPLVFENGILISKTWDELNKIKLK